MDISKLSIGEIVALLTVTFSAIGGFIISFLNFLRGRKTTKIDESSKILNSAMEMVDRFDKIVSQVKSLEDENLTLRKKIEILEKTLLEIPTYKKFFEFNHFNCLILYADTGKIFDSNIAFRERYGYTEEELSTMTIFDISLQPEETKNALESKLDCIPSRLHRNKKGEAFLVEVRAIYHHINGVNYAFCIYIPKLETMMASRVQNLLSEIIQKFESDYATIWVIHNGGNLKLSGLFESAKSGNKYLFQDYRRIPATIFSDLFEELSIKKYVVLSQYDDKHEPARLMLKHANLDTILFAGVIYDKKLIGMVTTSWRDKKPQLEEEDISRIIKYAESELVKNVVINEVHVLQ